MIETNDRWLATVQHTEKKDKEQNRFELVKELGIECWKLIPSYQFADRPHGVGYTPPEEVNYRHSKNGSIYMYWGKAILQTTGETMVVYEREGKVWARPVNMFFEKVMLHGASVPRFVKLT